jgi:hypothetical protein
MGETRLALASFDKMRILMLLMDCFGEEAGLVTRKKKLRWDSRSRKVDRH